MIKPEDKSSKDFLELGFIYLEAPDGKIIKISLKEEKQ